VHVDRERLDRHRIELAAPSRHDAAVAVPDALDDCLGIGTIKPNLVRQIWCAKRAISFAVGAMTNRAIVGEDFRTAREIGPGRRSEPGQRSHVFGNDKDFVALEHAIAAECRHRALVSLLVARAHAVRDRLRNSVEAAAP